MSESQRTPLLVREQYRRMSRRILGSPTLATYHKERIRTAMSFFESEPLQGALADYFYGCWYDVPHDGQQILDEAKERLSTPIYQAFLNCIHKKNYIWDISPLATRWSVLVVPSLDVPTHKLRTSSDNAWYVADNIITSLLKAKEDDNPLLTQMEDDFLEHCIACADRMAFMVVWFRLNKENWQFDTRWANCRKLLESI
ncbi:MAG: hypothetical protein Q3971_08940 [Moraxella sp.]|nr:hypothetical protein [Moraxella sp.]